MSAWICLLVLEVDSTSAADRMKNVNQSIPVWDFMLMVMTENQHKSRLRVLLLRVLLLNVALQVPPPPDDRPHLMAAESAEPADGKHWKTPQS